MQTPPLFSDLGLSPDLLAAVQDLGFESPSAIQARAIPPALAGRDLVGLSETGSGKTAAFALPALQMLDVSKPVTQVLVLCPTRELAVQVCEQTHQLGSHMHGLHLLPVYGGAPIDRQMRLLRQGTHIVVGTPGRLLDHIRRGSFDTSHIRLAVLDEADRMLDMGFREEMETLLASLPEDRQTLFFSATMNRNVERLIKRFSRDPETIAIERPTMTVESVTQFSYEVRNRSKIEVLSRLLDLTPPRLAIIFCNTKRSVDECTEALLARGYSADRLHGDIAQTQRERVLSRFREGTIELLVATDVAARGIDVDDVDAVFNYDLPQDPEDYVHRIGRTGRAGRSGKAYSFVFGRDIYRLQAIEKYIGKRIPRERIPSQEEVEGSRADLIFETVRDCLDSNAFADQQTFIERLLDQGYPATDIAAAVFHLLRESTQRERESIEEDRPRKARENPRIRDRDREGDRDREERPRRRAECTSGPSRSSASASAPAGATGGTEAAGGFTQLFINVGRASGAAPGEIAGMIYSEAELPDGSVGRIQLQHKFSLIDVRSEYADRVIKATRQAKVKGIPVRMDFPRKRTNY